MVNQVYVIYDRTAEESGPVFEAKNDGVALRNFQMMVKDKPFSEDYVLLHIGEIDHGTSVMRGTLDPREVIPTVSMADDLGPEEVAV